MFFLSLIEHTLRLPPHLLSLPLPEAIQGELETLFLDKVIPNLGLSISVYDIRSINGGFIFAGDGSSTYTVDFRLVMFRPFVGEIISGKVEALDASGLRLSLGFFKDILVPVHFLPSPYTFGEDGIWTWTYQGVELPIEKDDELNCRFISGFITLHIPPSLLNKKKMQRHLLQWRLLQRLMLMVWVPFLGGRRRERSIYKDHWCLTGRKDKLVCHTLPFFNLIMAVQNSHLRSNGL